MSKFGITLRKKEEPTPVQQKPKAAIFEQDSDEEKEKEDQSASAKFQRKYANMEKSKDKRMVEKLMAENSDIYDYDGQYEKMQQIRDKKIAEQKEADKEKKPKYAHKIMEAHKKRELEKLLHDEHAYKKAREQEAGEFDDKEVFITGAYRKQIEERNKFREELEENDRIDEMRDVKNQSMWQQAFQRKMLEQRARDYTLDEEEKDEKIKMKEDPHGMVKKEEIDKEEQKEEKEVKKEIDEMEEPKTKRRREEDRTRRERKRSEERHRNEAKQRPADGRKYHHHERERRTSQSSSAVSAGMSDSTRRTAEPESEGKKPSRKGGALPLPPVDDLTEEDRRMEIIRQILARRNGPKEVEEARKRYFERREAGEIMPPF